MVLPIPESDDYGIGMSYTSDARFEGGTYVDTASPKSDGGVNEMLELCDILLRALLEAHGLVRIDVKEDVLAYLRELAIEP